MHISDPPKNSQIRSKMEFDGVTLFWKKPDSPIRYAFAAFLVVWLLGWFAGFVAVFHELSSGGGAKFFHASWLAGWTFGGIFAMTMIFLLLRPHKPERISLKQDRLTYDTGQAAPFCDNPFWLMNRKQYKHKPFRLLYQKRKIYDFARAECPDIVLEGFGDNQRLRFDDGADRIVIGESLTEPEREWLARVLTEWKAS